MEKYSRHSENENTENEDIIAGGGVAFGPDGTPMGGIGQPEPVPPRTEEHFVCLRGPCRHYWHLVTMVQAGNPAGTWEELGIEAPRQHHHTCMVNPAFETSFEDDNVFDCNKWDPYTETELVQIRNRRDEYKGKTENAGD